MPAILAALALASTSCTASSDASPAPAAHTGERPSSPERPAPTLTLATDNSRESPGVVAAGAADAPYNYAPAVMADGHTTKMWWCSQLGAAPPAGDDILYGEGGADGPFTAPGGGPPPPVLSGNPGGFDGAHTCDPSVIRVEGTYYMYYTGAAGDHALGNSIGLATSKDGQAWTRANSGRPIVNPAHDKHRENTYGAGQPAAVYLDGWFYLMFTDTTGRAAGWNGAGQFLLRAKDPTFGTGVEALGEGGFAPVFDTEGERTNSLVDAFSSDLMWVDALDAFAIAHETAEGTTITFWNRDFTANPYHPALVPGPWQEGPGLLREPEGHARVDGTDPCGRIPIDLVRATVIGAAGAPDQLRRFGIDFRGADACTDPARTARVLEGFAAPSPVRTMDVVIGGKLVRVERRSVAEELADRVLDHRVPAFDQLPVSATVRSAAPVVSAPLEGYGMVLDDGKLWPISSERIAELNGSAVEQIPRQRWDAYDEGSVLGR